MVPIFIDVLVILAATPTELSHGACRPLRHFLLTPHVWNHRWLNPNLREIFTTKYICRDTVVAGRFVVIGNIVVVEFTVDIESVAPASLSHML